MCSQLQWPSQDTNPRSVSPETTLDRWDLWDIWSLGCFGYQLAQLDSDPDVLDSKAHVPSIIICLGKNGWLLREKLCEKVYSMFFIIIHPPPILPHWGVVEGNCAEKQLIFVSAVGETLGQIDKKKNAGGGDQFLYSGSNSRTFVRESRR